MEFDLGPLIDALPGLVWTAHPDGRAEYLGKGWLDYTGMTFEEAAGLGWIVAVHPDDAAGLLQAWRDIIASGRGGEHEARLRRHDGVYRWFLFRPSPMPATPGCPPRWCGMNIDIDDRVRVKRYLTEAQRISRTGSFTWDVEADEHNWSDETYRIWEVKPGTKLTAQTLLSAVHPDDLGRTEALIGGAVRGEDFDLLFRIITPSGALKHMHAVGRRIAEITDRPVFLGTLHDVTEGQIAAEALKRANNYLTEAQRLSQTGSFIWDVAADEHDWSDEVFRIFEFEPGTRVSNPLIHAVIHPDDMPAVETTLTRADMGLEFDFVFRIVTASGARKHVRVVGRRMEQVVDRLVYIGAIQDVTAIKAAEEALAASERDLRLLVDSIPGMVAVFSAAGTLETVNQQLQQYFGGLFEQHKDWDSTDHVHPEDEARVVEAFRQAVATGEPFEIETRARRHDGVYRWFQSRGTPLKDTNGNVVRWYNLLIDIDERKRAEEALKRSEAELTRANRYLKAGQRLSKTGNWTWDPSRKELDWSDETYRIFELDPAETPTRQSAIDVIHPDDLSRWIVTNDTAAETGEGYEHNYRIITPSGALKYLRVVSERLEDIADRPVFLGTTQDITESAVAAEALEKARTELAHVARVSALGALTASIAHEVNQPLSGILTNASTCLRMLAEAPPNIDGARRTAQRTIRDSQRASEVIKGLRAMFARKNRPTETVDLNDAAREVLALSSSELQSARVIVRSNFAADLPFVVGDRVQLQQVILNLVLNAADALRHISNRPRNLILTTLRGPSNHVTLSVSDDGIGIDPQQIDRVFDTFYTTKSDGMGIGLSISRTIVEGHDGRLWAEPNVDGPGTTFSFAVPCAGATPVSLRKDA